MLTLAEKVRFVEELVENVKRDLIRYCEKWPEEWDGHELRRLVSQRFQSVVMGQMGRGRTQDYENEVIVRGLL